MRLYLGVNLKHCKKVSLLATWFLIPDKELQKQKIPLPLNEFVDFTHEIPHVQLDKGIIVVWDDDSCSFAFKSCDSKEKTLKFFLSFLFGKIIVLTCCSSFYESVKRMQ